MRAAALFAFLLPLATAVPSPAIAPLANYEPPSANPEEWDPTHPPLAAILYGDKASKPSVADSNVLLVPDQVDKGNTAQLTLTETDGWQWPAYLAAGANCAPTNVQNWTCGENCQRAGRVRILYSGGNNKQTPWWYVGVSGPTIVVVIKGTNTDSLRSLLRDAHFTKDDLDSIKVKVNGETIDAFPNCDGAEVHAGFLNVFQDIQPYMQPAIQRAWTMNATRILVVGHSLGAAAAQITAVHLQHLYPNVTVSARLFGSPRIGDPDYANYADKTLGNRTLNMINEDDMVPHLPPKLFHYKHSSGEIWRRDDKSGWEWCKGQQNDRCSDSVDGEFSSKHDGPYAGVYMGCTQPEPFAAPNITNYNWTDTGLVNGGQS